MAALTSLRPSSGADRAYVEHVYFETQRGIIEALFGWRGEDVERAKFAEFYDESNSTIIVADGEDVGWMTVIRHPDDIELTSIYLQTDRQRNGIGTALIRNLMREASETDREIRLSTAIINPARTLYARLGFVVVREDQHKVHMTWSQEHDASRRAALDALIDVAEKMIAGDVGAIEGSRTIVRLMYSVGDGGDDFDDVFLPFVGIWSEANDMVVGDRSLWSAEFLERIDRQYESYERDVSPTIADECRTLLAVLAVNKSLAE